MHKSGLEVATASYCFKQGSIAGKPCHLQTQPALDDNETWWRGGQSPLSRENENSRHAVDCTITTIT